MASPCLGCGTITDANGDLTIYGARSSAWKPRYGPSIDDVNGLRCDPETGKLWVAPPMKSSTWVMGVGAWNTSLVVPSGTFDAYVLWVGDPSPAVLQAPTADAIVGKRTDPQDFINKVYVAGGQTFTWTNSTVEEQTFEITTRSRLGAGSLYAGGVLTTAKGLAGVALSVNVAGNITQRTIEHGLYHGNGLTPGLTAVMPFSVTSSDCSRTDVFTVEPGENITVQHRPYFRSDFGGVGHMLFIWDYEPRTIIRATSAFRHSDGLDAA